MDYIVPFTKKSFGEFTMALNHRMTNIESTILILKNDVNWTKKILWCILGVLIISLINVIMGGK